MYKICTAQTLKNQRLIATDEGVEGDIERSRHDDETVYARKAFAFAPRSNFASGNTRSLYEPVFGDFLFVQNLFKVVAEGGKGCVRCVLHVDFFESEKIIERTAEIIRKRKSVFKTRNGYLAYPLVNCRRIEIQSCARKLTEDLFSCKRSQSLSEKNSVVSSNSDIMRQTPTIFYKISMPLFVLEDLKLSKWGPIMNISSKGEKRHGTIVDKNR